MMMITKIFVICWGTIFHISVGFSAQLLREVITAVCNQLSLEKMCITNSVRGEIVHFCLQQKAGPPTIYSKRAGCTSSRLLSYNIIHYTQRHSPKHICII